MADNLHDGHRARLRARVNENGLDSLEAHEQLEYLLFFAIPRCNTNPIAHRLIDRFGSFAGVCDASEAELCTVEGVGPRAAELIHSISKFARVYLASDRAVVPSYTAAQIGDLLVRHYVGVREEMVTALFFGPRLNLLALEALCTGAPTSANLPVRQLCQRAFALEAAYIVLAHNHPGGIAEPSHEDIYVTQSLRASLERVQLPLLEHFVIADRQAVPMLMGDNLRAGRDAQLALDLRQFYAPREV